jgi:hypothetical protein
VANGGWLDDDIVELSIYLSYIEDITEDILKEKNGLAYPRNNGIFLLSIVSITMYGLGYFDRMQIAKIFNKDGRDFKTVKLAIIPVHRVNHFFVLIFVRPDMIFEVI